MAGKLMFDWDSAIVTVTVPVHHTCVTEHQQVELPLESFARLLLTSVPSEWFVQPPVSHDLPLCVDPGEPHA